MGIYWEKESYGSLVDGHVSVLGFFASLRTQGEPACHAKEEKSLWSLNFWFTTTYDLIGFTFV